MFAACGAGLSGSAFTSKGYNLCKGRLNSDIGEFAEFTLTAALRTWPSRSQSKCSTFPRRHSCLGILCTCRQMMSPTCTEARSEFALLECWWCSRSSVRYSDRHRFQKWSRIRCRHFALLVSVVTSLRPTSLEVLLDGIDRILRPIIRWEGVNGSSISSYTYVNGREFRTTFSFYQDSG